jgi:hypothetical protein
LQKCTYVLHNLVDLQHALLAGLRGGGEVILLSGLLFGNLDVGGIKLNFANL